MDDAALLHQYVADRSPKAFGDLVERYLPLVASAARRQFRDSATADDVTQAVFIVLARRASSVKPQFLAGWLLKTTYFAARDARKHQSRRAHHEQQAAAMKSTTDFAPASSEMDDIQPHLDRAMARLSISDRSAIALRFLQGKSFNEVGQSLNSSERAAIKRTHRALSKLRRYLTSAGVTLSAAPLADLLSRIPIAVTPANASAVASAALSAGSVGTASMAIAAAAIKSIVWSKVQVSMAIVFILVAAAVTATAALHSAAPASRTAASNPTTPPGPRLEIRLAFTDPSSPAPKDAMRLANFSDPKKFTRVDNATLLDESSVSYAKVEPNQPMQSWTISISFTQAGGDAFEKITSANINHSLAIIVDGKVLSAPTVRSPIRRSAAITGSFNRAQAQQICDVINSVSAGAFTFSKPATLAPLPNGVGANFVDLDAGDIIAPPPTFQATPDAAPFFKTTNVIKQWIRDNFVDLLVQSDGKSIFFTTLEAYEPTVGYSHPLQFDQLDPHKIFDDFSKRDPLLVSGFNPSSMSFSSPDPRTMLLRTREGLTFAVEITAPHPGAPVTLRCKQIEYPAK